MANNLHRWCNSVNLTGSDIDTKSTSGFQPNDYLQSNVFNTILKETSLVSQMIGDFIGGSINVNTTTADLLKAFQTKINNSTVASAENINQSSTGYGILYQNEDNTTNVLEKPTSNNKVLTYNDSLKWQDISNLPIFEDAWQTANGNAIAVSEAGNYLIRATISCLRDTEELSSVTINELFCIDDITKPFIGKIIYTGLISASQPGNDVNAACQIKYNGRNIVCYIQPITSSTTIYDLINLIHNDHYNQNVKLEYRKLKRN